MKGDLEPMRARKAALLARTGSVLAHAKAEDREVTPAEDAECTAWLAEVAALDDEIEIASVSGALAPDLERELLDLAL